MKRIAILMLGFLAWSAASSPVTAASINLATGLDSSNNLISSGGVNDAHWTVTTDPTFSPTGIPQTVFPNNADFFSGWVANGPNSDWIARNANVTDNGPAPYTFSRTFTLAASDLASASISGSWTIDDAGTLNLNGNQLGSLSSGGWSSLHSFSVPTGSADFVLGTNTLSITITSDDRFLEGARLEGTLTTASTGVPEPATLHMASISVVTGLGWWWYRRRRGTANATA
jgi:hypothetical protein